MDKRALKGLGALLVPLFFFILFSGCSINETHGEYYENGYNSGYAQGQSDVRGVMRITHSSQYKYMSRNQFNAETAYELKKRTTVWGLDESHEPEHRRGFIAGYEKGVEDQLGQGGVNYSQSTKISSSDSFDRDTADTGIKFWQWIIIIVGITPILTWLGFGADSKNTTDNPTSVSTNNERVLVTPWKSLLLVLFVYMVDVIIRNLFTLNEYNWSTYILLIIELAVLYDAYKNAKVWQKHNGSTFLCGLAMVLAIIMMLFMALVLCVDLYWRLTK